jgi:hypothetical protein
MCISKMRGTGQLLSQDQLQKRGPSQEEVDVTGNRLGQGGMTP